MANLIETPCHPIEMIPMHEPVWMCMRTILATRHLPQALLFIGPPHAKVLPFAYRFIAHALCMNEHHRPCGQCPSCRHVIQASHPNVDEIRPETLGGTLKVEQIRELQQRVYHKPRHGHYQFVLIHPADQLNHAAANALLKILEEPPSHLVFILVAHQSSTLPSTILSRCQKTLFPVPSQALWNYVTMGEHYPEGSSRHVLYQQRDDLILQLCIFLEGQSDPCSLAAAWGHHGLDDILWFLYTLIATLIACYLNPDVSQQPTWVKRMMRALPADFPQPMHLFKQLDSIMAFMRKNYQNITLNSTLVLEKLLLEFIEKKHDDPSKYTFIS